MEAWPPVSWSFFTSFPCYAKNITFKISSGMKWKLYWIKFDPETNAINPLKPPFFLSSIWAHWNRSIEFILPISSKNVHISTNLTIWVFTFKFKAISKNDYGSKTSTTQLLPSYVFKCIWIRFKMQKKNKNNVTILLNTYINKTEWKNISIPFNNTTKRRRRISFFNFFFSYNRVGIFIQISMHGFIFSWLLWENKTYLTFFF